MDEGTHVLVVEDDPAVRDVVRRYLERDGHRVSTAADGETGLLLARTESPDLVVLDLMLGGIDGVEVCRRLRAEQVYVPVVMLTALADEDHRITGLSVGADDYVTKPFSVKELALRVQAVLRRVRGGPVGVTAPLRRCATATWSWTASPARSVRPGPRWRSRCGSSTSSPSSSRTPARCSRGPTCSPRCGAGSSATTRPSPST